MKPLTLLALLALACAPPQRSTLPVMLFDGATIPAVAVNPPAAHALTVLTRPEYVIGSLARDTFRVSKIMPAANVDRDSILGVAAPVAQRKPDCAFTEAQRRAFARSPHLLALLVCEPGVARAMFRRSVGAPIHIRTFVWPAAALRSARRAS